jgi:hypothetical protein
MTTVTGFAFKLGSFGATEAKWFWDGTQNSSGELKGDSSAGGGAYAGVGDEVGAGRVFRARGTCPNMTTMSGTRSSAPPRRPIPTIM